MIPTSGVLKKYVVPLNTWPHIYLKINNHQIEYAYALQS